MGCIENTAAAFETAIAKGCGIECDVRPDAGKRPIVFHDETGERLLGSPRRLDSLAEVELRWLRHQDGSGVLSFQSLLELVAGRGPLLVEIKSDWARPNLMFLGEIARLAGAYPGSLALMSFDSAQVAVLSGLVAGIPCGLVSRRFDLDADAVDRFGIEHAKRLAAMEDFVTVGASFSAYDVRSMPTEATQALRRNWGIPVFAWTVRDEQGIATACDYADSAIFEGPAANRHYSLLCQSAPGARLNRCCADTNVCGGSGWR